MLIQCIKTFIYFTYLAELSCTYILVRPDELRGAPHALNFNSKANG